jgi:2-polyprenyl-3-methyl-5-hydroxy-6-metoxy-1,4-benzoquinol methylase
VSTALDGSDLLGGFRREKVNAKAQGGVLLQAKRLAAKLVAWSWHLYTGPALRRIEQQLLTIQNTLFVLHTIHDARRGDRETTYAEDVVAHFSGGISSPMFERYVKYALGSLSRGKRFVELHAADVKGVGRFLDVGCAYGGSVLAVAMSGVPFSVGVDVDDRFLNLARKQAAEVGLADCVGFQEGDITQAEAMTQLGEFGLVTCFDVLEHVLDPTAAIRSLARLTSPGGVLLADVPNPLSHPAITADPHNKLFGNTLLTRDKATKVFEQLEGKRGPYRLGYYKAPDWYMTRLDEAGFDVGVLDSPDTSAEAWERAKRSVRALRSTFERLQLSERWPRWRAQAVGEALEQHLKAFEHDAREPEVDVRELQIRYSVPVTHFRCIRRSST